MAGGAGKTPMTMFLMEKLSERFKSITIISRGYGRSSSGPIIVSDGTGHIKSAEIGGDEPVMMAHKFPVLPVIVAERRAAGIKLALEQFNPDLILLDDAFQHRSVYRDVDILLIDTAAGIDKSVISFCRASQEVVVVVCDEPSSITDAYALIKVLNKEQGINRFRVLANMAHDMKEGRELFTKILKVTDRFLDVSLDFLGAVPFDIYLRKAVKKQKAVSQAYPRSSSAQAFNMAAQKINKWPMPKRAGGHLEFFVERLINAD